ncbi:MAG: A24 family peptidase [Polyangiales bacterium]
MWNWFFWSEMVVLLLTLVAAYTDLRGGVIPNWLTVPAFGLGLVATTLAALWHGSSLGWALLHTAAGVCACALVPFLMFRQDALGGGDLKLLAAIGAWLGPLRGLELQFYAFIAAAVFALLLFAWRGELCSLLGRSLRLLITPFLPKSKRRPPAPQLLHRMRFGGAAFVAALLVSLSGPVMHALMGAWA